MAYVVNTLDQAEEKIKNEESFKLRGGTLTGGPVTGSTHGHLPERYHEDHDASVYAVRSYSTPIAWVRKDGTKTVPDVGYSDTTSQHQYLVLNAWKIHGQFPRRGRELRPAGGGPRRGGIDS